MLMLEQNCLVRLKWLSMADPRRHNRENCLGIVFSFFFPKSDFMRKSNLSLYLNVSKNNDVELDGRFAKGRIKTQHVPNLDTSKKN